MSEKLKTEEVEHNVQNVQYAASAHDDPVSAYARDAIMD